MKRNIIIPVLLFFTAFCFIGGTFLLALGPGTKTSPALVNVTLFRTDLMASQGTGTVNIFSNATGTQVDIVNNPDAAFGQGDVSAGTYKRIKFIVQNAVAYSGPDPCVTGTTTTTFKIDPTKPDTDQVELVFATIDDNGSGSTFVSKGTSTAPLLLQNPVEIKGGVTNVVKLIFDTSKTLTCDSGMNPVLLLPDMKVVNTYLGQPPSCAQNFPAQGQQYWFSGFSINNTLFDGVSSNPTLTTILEKTTVLSRWGMVTFYKPDANGNGIAVITMNKPYDDAGTPGFAQNMHVLANDSGSAYFNGDIPVTSPTLTISYTLTGNGNLITYTPDGTQEQGYFSNDCSAYVGVDISSKKVNALTFGLKKTSGLASTFPPNALYAMIGPGFGTHYDPSTHLGDFGFGPVNGILSTSTSTFLRDTTFFWRTAIGSKPDYNTGTWASSPAEEASADTGTVFQSPIVRSDGLVPELSSSGSLFLAFGSNGSLITAASTTSMTDASHPLYAGMWIKVDPSPSLSDLSGSWIVGGLHAAVFDGGDGTWNSGDETPQFGMLYGKIVVSKATATFSTYTGTFAFRDVFSGMIWPVTETGTLEPHTDCYAYDPAINEGMPVTTLATSCTTTTNSIQGSTLPVFYMNGVDQYGGHSKSKVVLDVNKQLIGVWDAPDTDGTPCSESGGGACVPDPVTSTGTGIGIKEP